MPAIAEEVDAAIEEGVDVHFLTTPVRVVVENGRAVAVECVRMKLGDIDASGRPKPVPIEGSNLTIELDTLILAISERPDTSYIAETDGISRDGENIVVDRETRMTTRKGVFAGGDAVTGPWTVVEAMAAGKSAAETIEKYVSGLPVAREHRLTRPSIFVMPVKLSEEEVAKGRRPQMRSLSVSRRAKNFNEVERGLTEAAAKAEARRCLRCDLETEDGKKAQGEKS
jgi:NADPH-dependent glutamate synthase beta subunit-like oxidoreductase